MLSRDRCFVAVIVLVSTLSRVVSAQSGQPAGSQPLTSKPGLLRQPGARSADRSTASSTRRVAAGPPLTGFVQAEPLEGQPASERTEVRILYDDEAIYVGVTLHDSDPSQIVTTDTSRDAGLGDMDSFQIIFDTFHDQQNGFVFGTNAAGIQYDAQVRNQGEPADELGRQLGGRDASGDGDGLDGGVPHPAAHAALRPGAADVGHELLPQHPAHARADLLGAAAARITTGRACRRPASCAASSSRRRAISSSCPTPSARPNRNFTPGLPPPTSTATSAFDAKFGVTRSLNLDLTYNTDFAQVEVDTAADQPHALQPALSGEAAVLPGELRALHRRARKQRARSVLQPAHRSRRGRGPRADQRRRAAERQGRRLQRRRAEHADRRRRHAARQQLLGAARQPRSAEPLRRRRHVRQPDRDRRPRRTDDWNRTWGADGRFGRRRALHGRRLRRAHRNAGTHRPRLRLQRRLRVRRRAHRTGSSTGRPARTSTPRSGSWRTRSAIGGVTSVLQETMRQERIRNWGFRECLPHVNYTRYDYLDGGLKNAELHVDNHWDWENGYRINTALNGTWEGLREPFEVYPGVVVPPGDTAACGSRCVEHRSAQVAVRAATVGCRARSSPATRTARTLQMIIREGGRFTVDTTWTYRASPAAGSFHTNLGNMRVTYNFSPSIFVQSLIQYNDRTSRWSTNLRFHWLETAGTGLFVVYNDTESLDGLGPVNRAFIVKYVRQFDLLR